MEAHKRRHAHQPARTTDQAGTRTNRSVRGDTVGGEGGARPGEPGSVGTPGYRFIAHYVQSSIRRVGLLDLIRSERPLWSGFDAHYLNAWAVQSTRDDWAHGAAAYTAGEIWANTQEYELRKQWEADHPEGVPDLEALAGRDTGRDAEAALSIGGSEPTRDNVQGT